MRNALVLGGAGFIGSHVAAALRGGGWHVRRAVRTPLHADDVHCELARMDSPAVWVTLLDGVDVVVNAAGILREVGGQGFEAIHVRAPLALAEACRSRGVRRFIQVSAIGFPGDGEFIASKHRADEQLLAMDGLEVVVLRPSVVYATGGSYGGTSLLRALAAFPGVLPLPGRGQWCIQPVAAEDLAQLVCLAADSKVTGVFDVAGPEQWTLRDYLHAWRAWLRLPPVPELRVPEAVVSAGVSLAERLGRGPLSQATWRMLRSGNVAAADGGARLQQAFGAAPRSMSTVLAAQPSQAQDRWHARLWLLAPALRAAIIVLFVLSALAGFLTPAAQVAQMAAGSALAPLAPALALSGAVADLVLAVLLLVGWRARAVLTAMGLLVFAYTLVLGLAIPPLWLDPLGGLAKNLVVLPALAALWILADRR